MITSESFAQSILQSLEDYTLRLIYADWLEEQGRAHEAYVQRWMGLRRQRPHYRKRGKIQDSHSWAWYTGNAYLPAFAVEAKYAHLPFLVFKALPGQTNNRYDAFYAHFDSALSAEKALSAALLYLKELTCLPTKSC